MGHRITAIVGKRPIDEKRAHTYDLPFFYEGEFVIVALDASHNDYWAEKFGLGYVEVSSVFLDTKCTHQLASKLGLNCFTVINTDYFGGTGTQLSLIHI